MVSASELALATETWIERMERQRRVLYRADPPEAWFIVDEHSLFRHVGSPRVMAAQMRHLAEVAGMPNVTVQARVVPGSGRAPALALAPAISC